MQEEIFYTLSDISASLSVFRQPTTNWEQLTCLSVGDVHWRTRWDTETGLLIEEEDSSKTHWGNWQVSVIHQDVKDKTKAVLIAAKLTSDRQEQLEKDAAEFEKQVELETQRLMRERGLGPITHPF